MTNKPSHLIKIESTPDLVDRVYRSLLDAISSGTLAPGRRIKQEEVAEQLAVSRQPVLLALRLLKKDGFVWDAPGRGLLVAPIDGVWLGQVYQIRCALDALAARLAAKVRAVMDPELIRQGRLASSSQDVQAMMAADAAFHNAIYAASGNPLIAQSAQLHWQHIRRAMGAVLQLSTMRESIWDEHQDIAQAIQAGDAQRAESLSREHGEDASLNLARMLANALLPAASPAPGQTFSPTH
jgi:DNA-binding GntR family transcriptional regulator